jgi:long-subunit acyl-CoA synthetase (AMP-forming)
MASGIAFQGKDKPAQPCPPQPNDTCTIMYTSGTSGKPKGVMLSHESHGMFVKGMDLFMDRIDDKVNPFIRYNDVNKPNPDWISPV